MPSTFPESFGMVAAEAAACGALPISAAHSGLAEVSRVLAAGASPPNDLGFAEYEFDRVSDIAAAAQSAGFGFGEQGSAAGRFYDLPQLPIDPPIEISSNEPR